MEYDQQEERITNSFLVIVLVLAILGVIGSTVWHLMKNVFIITPTPPKVANQKVEYVEPASEERSDWHTYTNKTKGYSFQYPDGWITEEKNGFLNSTHLYPLNKEFEIIFSEGKIPYSFGRTKTSTKSLQVNIANEPYVIDEISVGNYQKLIDFPLKHPSKKLNVLIRTSTTDPKTVVQNINAYEHQKQIIFAVLTTITYYETKIVNAPGGFAEFNEFGFRLFYPKTMKITKKTDAEVAWNDEKMTLHSSSVSFPKLGTGTSIILDLSTNKIITIGEIIDKQVVFFDEIPADKLTFKCGDDCSYQMVRFANEPTYYELIYKGSDEESQKEFSTIVSAISFE